jgi:hypothetical protein
LNIPVTTSRSVLRLRSGKPILTSFPVLLLLALTSPPFCVLPVFREVRLIKRRHIIYINSLDRLHRLSNPPSHPDLDQEFSCPMDPSASLRQLSVYPNTRPIVNYVCLEFSNICRSALLSLFLAMLIEISGLGLDPLVLGYIFNASRVFASILSTLAAQKFVDLFGEKQGFI